jgi:hypothetical protein
MKISCPEAEELMIQMQVDKRTRKKRRQLEQHLAYCIGCRKHSDLLKQLSANPETINRSLPQPAPHILPQLLQRMNQLQRTVPPKQQINQIRSFLLRPVPVYQAAIAVILALTFSAAAFHSDWFTRFTENRPQIEGMRRLSYPQQDIYIGRYQSAEDKNYGFNTLEDTAFARVPFLAM